MALLTPFPTFARGRTQWGACYCGWWLRAVGWPGGWRQAAAGGVRSAGCWRTGDRFNAQILSRKRGNLSIADDTRTNIQQRTQHTPDAPENGSCSHLRVICDCPVVFLANSVRAGGQRRPFHHAFKSLMRSSLSPGHLKFTLFTLNIAPTGVAATARAVNSFLNCRGDPAQSRRLERRQSQRQPGHTRHTHLHTRLQDLELAIFDL